MDKMACDLYEKIQHLINYMAYTCCFTSYEFTRFTTNIQMTSFNFSQIIFFFSPNYCIIEYHNLITFGQELYSKNTPK